MMDIQSALLSHYNRLGSSFAERSSASTPDSEPTAEQNDRVIHDTIELSDGAKQINLARGFELAELVRNEKDPAKLQELLRTGQEDINRISRLFQEVSLEVGRLFSGFQR